MAGPPSNSASKRAFDGTTRKLLITRERCSSRKLVQGLVSKKEARLALL